MERSDWYLVATVIVVVLNVGVLTHLLITPMLESVR
jgi:hypothetical protein